MGRRIIGLSVYLQVIQAFKKHGQNYAAVSRDTNLDQRTIARFFEQGLIACKRRGMPAFPPIEKILSGEVPEPGTEPPKVPELETHTEQADLTPELQPEPAPKPEPTPAPQAEPAPGPEPTQEVAPIAPELPPVLAPAYPTPAVSTTIPDLGKITPEDIREHAQHALREELRAIEAVRDAAIGAAVSARKMLGALQCRIDRMGKEAAEQNACGVPVDQNGLSRTMQRILIVADKASQITKQVIESERLALGSPTEIIKVMEAPAAVAPEAEAVARSERVLAFLSGRRKDRPALPPINNRFVEEIDEETEDEDPVEAASGDDEVDDLKTNDEELSIKEEGEADLSDPRSRTQACAT